MKIICIEGCHGCGKTEIVKTLAKLGYKVLDEGFLDMPKFSLSPQSFIMESLWVAKWFERVLKLQKEYGNGVTFFADRSPYSALFYAPNGMLLEPYVREAIRELAAEAGIEIVSVYISVKKAILWHRISDRLKREPERTKYREDQYEWMEKTLQFYNDEQRNWDHIITNNEDSPGRVVAELQQHVLF